MNDFVVGIKLYNEIKDEKSIIRTPAPMISVYFQPFVFIYKMVNENNNKLSDYLSNIK